ncbi:Sortase family protein [Amycolatopsis pretoriensis]|uniref:Sortase family protein n=1 Tax=Amycolatopsis pretoriensis TaxID=218821 RepID=A0A1H5R1B0_9PSEU|nr:class F sortase [Amycolatopsis pretoriensis]SEF32170.1 Sortase family protein [Amycolatopsis pretoriensis]
MRQEKLVGPAAAVLAVVAGLGCVLLGVTTVLAPGTSMTAGAAPRERPATGVLPAALVIPALDLVVNHLVDLGHIAGRREQPGTADGVGWFADGPAPGAPGVAVLSGHTGFGFSRGAFARLGTLQPGSAVMVRDDEGREARFTVRRTETFAPDEPDSTLVAPEGPGPELRLITSDGSHDTAGMNGPRVAVYATPV